MGFRSAPIPVIHKTDRLVPGSAGFGSERRLLLDHFNRRKPYRPLSNRSFRFVTRRCRYRKATINPGKNRRKANRMRMEADAARLLLRAGDRERAANNILPLLD
jgi:hypothetical protein